MQTMDKDQVEPTKEELIEAAKNTPGTVMPDVAEEKSFKRIKKEVRIIVDSAALPKGMTPQDFVKVCDMGFVFYDSNKGNRPEILAVSDDVKYKASVVDTTGEEIDYDLLNRAFAEEEYWDKELYKCQRAPLYYYTEYATNTPKPTQEELEDFQTKIGTFGNKTTAEEKTENLKKFAETLTIDSLKAMKPVVDKMVEGYNLETTSLINKLAKILKFDPENEEKMYNKLIAKTSKYPVLGLEANLKGYVINNKYWDKQMLRVTELDVLVRLVNTLFYADRD